MNNQFGIKLNQDVSGKRKFLKKGVGKMNGGKESWNKMKYKPGWLGVGNDDLRKVMEAIFLRSV